MTNDVQYVSSDEFANIVKRMEVRQKAVAKAQRVLTKAKTLDEKIAAQRALKAARNIEVL